MASPTTSLEHDWLGACRRSVRGGAGGARRELAGPRARAWRPACVGVGGDRTLVIDQRAEDLVIGELRALHDEGARFTLVSEECGVGRLRRPRNGRRRRPDRRLAERQARPDAPRAVDRRRRRADDGRRRARLRPRLRHRRGVARRARRRGVARTARCSSGVPAERRTADGRLEVVAVESAAPRWLAAASDALLANVHRVRALGSIAISLCQVAAGRADAMASLRGCRSVDAAAAQLIVRESGGLVAFGDGRDPLGDGARRPRRQDPGRRGAHSGRPGARAGAHAS